MSDAITYRQTDGMRASQVDWDALEHVLATRGWMSLNRHTTPAIVLAEDTQGLAGFFVTQFVPHAGPLWVRPKLRGGEVSLKLAGKMLELMQGARGVVIVADNPVVAKMCESIQMKRVESPVYVFEGGEV